MDSFVWTEILRLLDDPALIQAELARRMEAAKKADPLRRRGESLQREQVRVQKNIDRLVTAYQESLVTLEQLRQRMPDLRRQEHAVQAELVSLAEAAADQSKYLRLVENLAEFRGRLRARADSLAFAERQKILRLLVKEILVGKEAITIRHSIPTPHTGSLQMRCPDRLPCRRPSLRAEVIFCVRGVISPLLANIYLNKLDRIWRPDVRRLGYWSGMRMISWRCAGRSRRPGKRYGGSGW